MEATFLMEADTENMQSRDNEVKMHLLMHMEEGDMVQQKSHKPATWGPSPTQEWPSSG